MERLNYPYLFQKHLQKNIIKKFLVLGDVLIEEGEWTLISGYRRTTFDLPNNLLDKLQEISKEKDLSMSEYVEEALREKIEREEESGMTRILLTKKTS